MGLKDSRVTDIHDGAGTMCMGAQSTMHPTPQCYYLQTMVWRGCQSHGSTTRTNKTYLYVRADIPEKTWNLCEDLMQDAYEQAVSGAR